MSGAAGIRWRKLVPVNGRLLTGFLVLLLASVMRLGAAGDAFVIELSARADGSQRPVVSRSAEPATPTRLTVSALPRRKLEIKWSVATASGVRAVPDVTVHVFLERASAAGAANAPKASPNALYDSAVGVDFAPGSRSAGQIAIEVPDAGDYVLRVETIVAAATVGREQAAALDLKVSP
jgi:hypothetical protein